MAGGAMIIEFTGPSGSGKSSTIQELKRQLEIAGLSVVVVGEGETGRGSSLPSYVADTRRHNIKADIALFLPAMRGLVRRPRFAATVIGHIAGLQCNWKTRLAVTRSIWRKIGIFEYARAMGQPQPVFLVDEGTVHIAHNVLVDVRGDAVVEGCVRRFGALVPVPDIVVLLHAPTEILLDRLLSRGDLSPRVGNSSELMCFLGNAERIYRQLEQPIAARECHLMVFNMDRCLPTDVARGVMACIGDFR